MPTVAVFYPDSVLWQELRQGVRVCERKGLAFVEVWDEKSITLRTARSGRRVRFVLDDVRGVLETRDAMQRTVAATPSLLAVVGSSNTLLTVALAEALRDAGGPHGPVLLVPWAGAMQTERSEPEAASPSRCSISTPGGPTGSA